MKQANISLVQKCVAWFFFVFWCLGILSWIVNLMISHPQRGELLIGLMNLIIFAPIAILLVVSFNYGFRGTKAMLAYPPATLLAMLRNFKK